jgi:hypothetical protein
VAPTNGLILSSDQEQNTECTKLTLQKRQANDKTLKAIDDAFQARLNIECSGTVKVQSKI